MEVGMKFYLQRAATLVMPSCFFLQEYQVMWHISHPYHHMAKWKGIERNPNYWETCVWQSPSWEANTHSASQEIYCLLWNPRFITTFTRALPLILQSICIIIVSNVYNYIFLLNYNEIELTPWSRLLEKLIVAQLVKKFLAFYGIWRFITVFTRGCHWTLSRARWILFISLYSVFFFF